VQIDSRHVHAGGLGERRRLTQQRPYRLFREQSALAEQHGQRRFDARFAFSGCQVQDLHILLVRACWLLRQQGIVGTPIRHRRIEVFAIHITGKGPGLSHQLINDVPIVDVMLALATQARHPLQALLGVPNLDLLHADPHLDLFADQTRRDRVGVVFHANGASPPHAHLGTLQTLQPLGWQRPQVRHLLGDLGHPAGIPLGQHDQHQLPVFVSAGKLPAATQQQRLLQRRLEMPMGRLHVAILMPTGRVGRLRMHAVMPHQRTILVRELLRLAVVMHRQSHAVGPMTLRHGSQRP
jgi:hypothetical protein